MVPKSIVPLLIVLAMARPSGAAEAEAKGVAPFNGKDLTGWKVKGTPGENRWVIGKAALDPNDSTKLIVSKVDGNAAGELVKCQIDGVDLYTEAAWGDCVIDIEFMVSKGSNSGVYVMGEYELQVLDSFGEKEVTDGDVGGIFGVAAPKVNASKAPGEWQRFVIEFRAPRFEGGKKVAHAKFVKVTLNGTVIHENVEVKSPTGGALTGQEAPTGPLRLQGDHGPVAFRNIKIYPR
jgi:hypothetical protein